VGWKKETSDGKNPWHPLYQYHPENYGAILLSCAFMHMLILYANSMQMHIVGRAVVGMGYGGIGMSSVWGLAYGDSMGIFE